MQENRKIDVQGSSTQHNVVDYEAGSTQPHLLLFDWRHLMPPAVLLVISAIDVIVQTLPTSRVNLPAVVIECGCVLFAIAGCIRGFAWLIARPKTGPASMTIAILIYALVAIGLCGLAVGAILRH